MVYLGASTDIDEKKPADKFENMSRWSEQLLYSKYVTFSRNGDFCQIPAIHEAKVRDWDLRNSRREKVK